MTPANRGTAHLLLHSYRNPNTNQMDVDISTIYMRVMHGVQLKSRT